MYRIMNRLFIQKNAYEAPQVRIFDVKIEAGFAASGEGSITPGGDDGELNDGY